MALIKEDYGLIYNDDGSLCVTVRDDDVPFDGVKSFAVEEGTENLFSDNFLYINSSFEMSANDPTGKFKNVIKVNPVAESVYLLKDINVIPGESYSGQVWCYVSEDFDGAGAIGMLNERDLNALDLIYDKSKKGTWQLLKKENVIATSNYSSIARLLLYVYSGFSTGYVLFKNQQVEKKPFATSFVDGSRPEGKFEIPNNNYIENRRMMNNVISFWFKVPLIFSDEQNVSASTSTYSIVTNQTHGYLYNVSYGFDFGIPKYPQSGQELAFNISTGINARDLHFINDQNYFDRWVYAVIIKYEENDIEYYSLYLDGIKKVTDSVGNVASRYGDNYEKLLFNGHNSTYHALRSNLISNLFIGEYKDKNGNVIWTDEYIQEVYEAKKPFNTNL